MTGHITPRPSLSQSRVAKLALLKKRMHKTQLIHLCWADGSPIAPTWGLCWGPYRQFSGICKLYQ